MNFWEAILFGIIQGFTEIFPISSSAHLAILGNLFGVSGSGYNFRMMTVFLHFGTMIAIMIVYMPAIETMLDEMIVILRAGKGEARGQRHYPAVRNAVMILVSCLPLLLLIPFIDYLDTLYLNNVFIGVMMVLSGFVLFVSDRLQDGSKDERNMTFFDALLVGICQLVSAIPGISRIGTVMTACKATGMKKEFAVKYAYLLSLPVVFGMNIVHLVSAAQYGFSWKEVPMYIIGLVVSFLVGTLAMRIVRKAAENGKFHDFAYYCWVAGVMFIILTMIF